MRHSSWVMNQLRIVIVSWRMDNFAMIQQLKAIWSFSGLFQPYFMRAWAQIISQDPMESARARWQKARARGRRRVAHR